jgi:hypothetical protein
MTGDGERRPTEIEAQLARVSERLALGGPVVPDEIVALARSGRRLEAIQRYRALTNATIEEARLVVMAL